MLSRLIDKRNAILAIIIFVNVVTTLAQNPYIHHFTTLDGLPSNTIYQIIQDSQKFIWFTTDAGVVKYDGSTFTNFRKKDGLSSNDVVRIKEDSYGRIWLFNYNSSVNYIYNNTIYSDTNSPFLKSLVGKGFIYDFFYDTNKRINFYNWQCELFSLDSNNIVYKNKFFKKEIALPLAWNSRESVRVAFVSFNNKHELLVWTNYGIYIQKSFEEKVIAIDTNIKIMSVFPTGDSIWYLKTQYEGIMKINGEFCIESTSFPFNHEKVKSILCDSKGVLWITAFDEGVYCFIKHKLFKTFKFFGAQGIFEDRDNNIWIGTKDNGIYLIDRNIITQNHLEIVNFNDFPIEHLCPENHGGMWCSAASQLFLLKGNNKYTLNSEKQGLVIDDIIQLKNDDLIICYNNSIIKRFFNIQLDDKSRLIKFSNALMYQMYHKKLLLNSQSDELVLIDQNRIIQTKTSNMFDDYFLFYFRGRLNNAFYSKNGLFINSKKNFILSGSILAPCNKQLNRINGSIIADHLHLCDSIEILNVDNDTLFLMLNDTILYNLSEEFHFTTNDQIKRLITNKSSLYFSTRSNIFLCEHPENIIYNDRVLIQPLNLSFNFIYDIAYQDGYIYVASKDGLTTISETSIRKKKCNYPIPYFDKLFLNDQLVDHSADVMVFKGLNSLRINTKCIDFSLSPVIFNYYLEGSDYDWKLSTGYNLSVVYQDLSFGEYTFWVKTKKSNSDWSDPIKLTIIINPTFWQNPLTWLGVVIVGCILIILISLKIKEIRMQKIEVDNQLIVLEQKSLQSMMNPHFIFNSLGSIQNYLYKNKAGDAIVYLTQFARLIRQNLNAINLTLINLEEEVERIKNYFQLEQLRMGNKFDYYIDIDDQIKEDTFYIPTMIIQPFVENSIWHGIANINYKGTVRLKFTLDSDLVMKVIIEDNGVGMKHSKPITSGVRHLNLSMTITHKRLTLLSKKFKIHSHVEYSEVYPNEPHPGTRVELFIPYGNENTKQKFNDLKVI
jgi:hypothetical protein